MSSSSRKQKYDSNNKEKICTKNRVWYLQKKVQSPSLNHGGLLLSKVRVCRLVVGRDHVRLVPASHRSRRALHHHQPDGGLRGLWLRGVLLGGIFAPAVVHDTGYQEDKQQDNVAGDKDAQVQSDRVDLLVVFQKAHGARFMLGALRPLKTSAARVSREHR